MIDTNSSLRIQNMQIIINSVNFKADARLETFVKEKVSKLFYKCDDLIRANVTLREDDNSDPENKVCEIRLMIPGNDHFVKKCTEGYQKSVLQAVKVLQKIIRRKKTMTLAKRHAG
jgi:ribosome-associated translation inhibitor RaiA